MLDTNIYLHHLNDAEVIVNVPFVRLVVPITGKLTEQFVFIFLIFM